MAAPVITIINQQSGQEFSTWNVGAVKAGERSTPVQIQIWNNKDGATNISDLRGCTITTLDVGGGASSDVVAGKWVKVNLPHIDGSSAIESATAPAVAIGGETSRALRADGLRSEDGDVIKGSGENTGKMCTAVLYVEVEANAVPGTKNWKIRINGFYV